MWNALISFTFDYAGFKHSGESSLALFAGGDTQQQSMSPAWNDRNLNFTGVEHCEYLLLAFPVCFAYQSH
jgi:hypothetical protein